MAKKKHVNHVALLLDETGSMASHRDQVLDGVNEFIRGLGRNAGDKVLFTLAKFDSEHFTLVHDAAPIKRVAPLTREDYIPGAMTPLHDAIGKIVRHADRVDADSTLIAVYTDGLENCSQEYRLTQVKSLISAREDDGWQFTFLGADIDAYSEGGSLGVARGATISTSKLNAVSTFAAMSVATERWRGNNAAAGETVNYSYTAAEKHLAGDNRE